MTLLAAIVLNALWQDALLVFLVWLMLRVWPGLNAATRYAVWSATLIAAVLVPIGTTYASFVPVRAVALRSGSVALARSSGVFREAISRPATPALRASAQSEKRAMARFDVPKRLTLTIPANFGRAVVAAWALLAGYALFGLIVGLWKLERLKRDALPLPVEYRDAMPQWRRVNKGRRAVRLCVSDEIDVPVAVGLFDAMILIPRDLLERLSPSEVEQISLHELAHLRRGDDWSNCLQRLVIAALGWNPAAIFVAQQLELEREVACDDWVLSSAQSVRPYAMCLTKMAETAAWPHHPIPAPGVFTTRKQISLRIERLLASGRDIATTLSLGPAAVAVAGVVASAIVIAMVAPSIAAQDVVAPIAPLTPIARVSPAPTASPRVVERIKTVERIRIVRVRPVGVATPLHVAAVAAVAAARSVAQSSAPSAPSSRTCAACDYHGVNWAGRDLHGVNYSVADFTGAILTGVNFSESRLNVVDFSDANLTAASFRRARLSGCDFSHATLVSADFSGAVLTGCTFSGARLDNARFAGAKLIECDLDGVDLRHVDLSHAQLVNMDSLKQPSPP